MYHFKMRTTINIDDDVYQLASVYASSKGLTLGAAVGELVRKAQATAGSTSGSAIKTAPNGLPLFSNPAKPLTPEMVKSAQEDEIA